MEKLVDYLVKHIVDEPDQVQVQTVQSGTSVTYEVTVAENDIGKVIGRRGRVAEALRILVKSAPATEGTRHNVEIVS